MARITRVLLAAAAAVAAAGLAIAIVSSVSGHHATGSVVAPAAPEAVGRRASAAALFRSLRDRAFGGAAASAAAVGEAVDSAKEAVLALGPTPTPASAASIFGSLRDRALGGAAASAAAVGEAVDSAKEAVLALGPTSTPLAASTGQALQAQLLAAQNAAYGLAQVRKAAHCRGGRSRAAPLPRLASPGSTRARDAQRFTGGVGGGLDALLNAHQPRASLDVVETENELQVLADLAGFAPGDVRVEVDDTGVLSVHAGRWARARARARLRRAPPRLASRPFRRRPRAQPRRRCG